MTTTPTPTRAPGDLAVDFLLTTRSGDDEALQAVRDQLAAVSDAELVDGLRDDQAKLAFWIDLYNAAAMQQQDIDLSTWAKRLKFTRRAVVTVAGRPLTLDQMEHSLLRRSGWKLTFGYLGNPLPSTFERHHRVDRLDPRIHFTLNCAAQSCPPIAAYRADRIDEQLDVATRSYLQSSVFEEGDVIRIPQIFLWYPGDFGGPGGIRSFLRAHGVEGAGRPIRFAPYDWTPAPGKWAPEPGTEED